MIVTSPGHPDVALPLSQAHGLLLIPIGHVLQNHIILDSNCLAVSLKHKPVESMWPSIHLAAYNVLARISGLIASLVCRQEALTGPIRGRIQELLPAHIFDGSGLRTAHRHLESQDALHLQQILDWVQVRLEATWDVQRLWADCRETEVLPFSPQEGTASTAE